MRWTVPILAMLMMTACQSMFETRPMTAAEEMRSEERRGYRDGVADGIADAGLQPALSDICRELTSYENTHGDQIRGRFGSGGAIERVRPSPISRPRGCSYLGGSGETSIWASYSRGYDNGIADAADVAVTSLNALCNRLIVVRQISQEDTDAESTGTGPPARFGQVDDDQAVYMSAREWQNIRGSQAASYCW